MIPLVRIHNPNEYIMCIDSFQRMIDKGEMELVYATCPLDSVIDSEGRFYTRKLFHQFRCTNCSSVYGIRYSCPRSTRKRTGSNAAYHSPQVRV